MKTQNDILAGVALKEFGRCIKEAFGGTGKEVDDVCDSEH